MAISTIGKSGIAGGSALIGKNLVRNGAMQISQRGTITGMGGANLYSALDGFEVRQSGSPQGRFTSSQVALSLGDSATAGGFRQGLKVDCTTAEDAVGVAELSFLVAKVEAQDLQHLEWGTASAKAVTLSFTFSSPKTGVHCVSLYNYDSNTSYVAEFTIASANTYERFEITVPGPTDGGFNNDNGIGLGIQWPLVAGGNWQKTAGSWGNDEKYASGNQQNLLDNTSNNVVLTGVMLEEGSVGTDYPHVSVGDELLRNQRYLVRVTPTASDISIGYCNAAREGKFNFSLPIVMRAVPSIAHGTAGEFSHTDGDAGTGAIALSDILVQNANAQPYITLLSRHTGGGTFTVGETMRLTANDADAYFELTAEL